MAKKYKCTTPVLSDDEYSALLKRANKMKEPLPAREFEREHKLKPLGDYYDECSVCHTVVFKTRPEQVKIRNLERKLEEESRTDEE